MLRDFYELLRYFSTATHQKMCDDLIRALQARNKPTIADWYAKALLSREAFCNLEQPFLNPQSIASRKPLSAESAGDHKVMYHLSQKPTVVVDGGPECYSFTYIQQQIPPMRLESSGAPSSGSGGIDFIAHTKSRPVLGEVKLGDDMNPFYAFVQLLTYLTEMATQNQIERANRHNLFRQGIGQSPTFDLLIVLADFNDRREKGRLIKPTRQLAETFKRRLGVDYPQAASGVGNIICLKMDIDTFKDKRCNQIPCIWWV